ncbi:MAG TPA: DNA polymerase/3'-5' exonuclease PolX, partial [Candidatus Nanoarchaeia archaeon]|nr:DNA polymerase/3'-5' exonuclease PolX [Candidatus Nanoarchaeia archaeon]
NIKKGLELYKKGQERRLLGYVLPIAEELKAELDKLKEIKKIDIAGSVRRRKETIKDIDILVIGKNKEKIMDYFTSLPVVSRILAKGHTKSSVVLTNNMQADLRVLDPKNYGAALNYFTGSKEHNVRLRQIAIKKGYKFSEYGLFNRKTNRYIAGKTEQEVYKKLGLKYVEPELRESMGELDLEINKRLPRLITLKDIKGDLHSHTKATDGVNTIEEMALAAKKRGYEYLSISDHSKSTRVANGLNEKDLSEHLKKIDKINNKINGITLLKSSEVDILNDGSLDYNDKILKQMDIVLCSIHSGFKQDKTTMTKRLVKAIENPYTNIIGHTSGRLINRRDPYEFDIDKVFEAAKDNNVTFEINSQPDRLDLKDIYIKKAVENKVKLVINSDAHSAKDLWLIEFGVMQARRGWAEKKDILNTFPLRKLSKIFTNIKH